MKRKLLIDLGHSDKYPGANGVRSEVSWNRAIGEHMLMELRDDKYEILFVPDTYWNDTSSDSNLRHRIAWINANASEGDFLVSIHGNAAASGLARGVTTCYMGGDNFAKTEALKMSQDYSKATGVPIWHGGAFDDRDARFGRLGMVRDTKPFALLIEAGFVTNEEDMKVPALLAARAIASYYNSYGEPVVTPIDTELEEVKKWVTENSLANLEAGFDEPILKRDMLRVLYRFSKLKKK